MLEPVTDRTCENIIKMKKLSPFFPVTKSKGAYQENGKLLQAQEDLEWMKQFQAGRAGAFDQLFKRYKDKIYSYIFQMIRDEHRASELSQDVFMKVYERKDQFKESVSFKAWLYTIARNTTLDALDKKDALNFSNSMYNSKYQDGIEIQEIMAEDHCAEILLIEQANKMIIEKCIDGLSALQKDVFNLRIMGELSYEEIAQQLQVGIPSVKSAINKARMNVIHCVQHKLGIKPDQLQKEDSYE